MLHLQNWGRDPIAIVTVQLTGGVKNRGAIPDWAKRFLVSKVPRPFLVSIEPPVGTRGSFNGSEGVRA
jgi:hypothetical protein